jgi:hypothetical protein
MRNTCIAVQTGDGNACTQPIMLLLVSCNRPWCQVKRLTMAFNCNFSFSKGKKEMIHYVKCCS